MTPTEAIDFIDNRLAFDEFGYLYRDERAEAIIALQKLVLEASMLRIQLTVAREEIDRLAEKEAVHVHAINIAIAAHQRHTEELAEARRKPALPFFSLLDGAIRR